MKRYRTGIAAALCLGGIVISGVSVTEVARADETGERPSASAALSVYNKYIWRGFESSDDSIVIQPSVTVGYRGFSMNLWGNLDSALDDRDPATEDENEWTETDLTAAYGRSFGPVALGVGYIYYDLDGVDDSQEVYLSAGLDYPLSPALTIYREIAHVPGWYFLFNLGYTFELPRAMSLSLSGSMSYYYSDDEAFVKVGDDFAATTEEYRALHNGLVSAALTVPIDRHLSLTPQAAYSFPLSDDADNLITSQSFSNDSDFFYAGITLSVAF